MKYSIIALGIGIAFYLSACKKGDAAGEQIPNTPVSLQINLDLPSYFDLTLLGNWMYFPDGYKGIIVYHSFDGEYYAFDRACSYEPFKDCSQLWVDSTTQVYINCGQYQNDSFVKCCESRYEIPGGFPIQGPANQAMKSYRVAKSGNTLFINN